VKASVWLTNTAVCSPFNDKTFWGCIMCHYVCGKARSPNAQVLFYFPWQTSLVNGHKHVIAPGGGGVGKKTTKWRPRKRLENGEAVRGVNDPHSVACAVIPNPRCVSPPIHGHLLHLALTLRWVAVR